MPSKILTAALGLAFAAACSRDASTTAPGTPTTSTSAYTVSVDSGIVDSAPAPVASTVPVRIHVTKSGSAVSGAAVSWTITTGHGAVSSATTTTDATGATSVTWTLGDTAGVNTISAAALGASVSFHAIGVPVAALTLSRVTADSIAVAAGASVVITARAADRFGNAVPGSAVTWSTSAGQLTTTATTTGSTGNAETVLTTSGAGRYVVTAALPGKASISFAVTAF